MNDKVVNLISSAPKTSGVYKFKDEFNKIIYIGKAKNLKNRLKSYINYKDTTNPRLKSLYNKIENLEYEETDSEYEALLYESQLIKKFMPRYNVLLKDDKNYPYIKIDLHKPWPYLELARKISEDKALYFGPFPEASVIKQVLKILNKSFPLIKCRKTKFLNTNPCLNYQINRCVAPCAGLVSKSKYKKIVTSVIDILKGKKDSVIKEMERAMWGYSDAKDFESAIEIRNKVVSLKKFLDSQPLIIDKKIDFDFLYRPIISESSSTAELRSNISVLAFVRNGILLGQKVAFQIETKEELGAMLVRYYEDSNDIKQLLVEPRTIGKVYKDYLKEKGLRLKKYKTILDIEEIKKIESILDARLLQTKIRQDKKQEKEKAFITWIRDLTDRKIKRDFKIEVYDMSHLAGTEPVGAKVSFNNFEENKSNYRRYKIKNAKGGDDYGMMKEVLERRLKSRDTDPLPDIMLIDGGKGQLSKVYKIIKKEKILLLSIAKDKTRSKALSKDKIYIKITDKILGPYNPPEIVLQVLKRIRDESHRFVISYGRKRQNKINFKNK